MDISAGEQESFNAEGQSRHVLFRKRFFQLLLESIPCEVDVEDGTWSGGAVLFATWFIWGIVFAIQ